METSPNVPQINNNKTKLSRNVLKSVRILSQMSQKMTENFPEMFKKKKVPRRVAEMYPEIFFFFKHDWNFPET